MNIEFLKALWLLRFHKMKETEDEAAWNYQEILDECLILFRGENEVTDLLRQLVREERMHAKSADQLIRICRENHPELDVEI